MPLLNLIPDGYVVLLYSPLGGSAFLNKPDPWALCPTWATAIAASNALEAYLDLHGDPNAGEYTIQIVPSLRTRTWPT